MVEPISIFARASAESDTRELGDRGEALAAEFLIASGYRIVMQNFTVPVGRNTRGATVTGEIDIIALDKDVLCFVEVKTRTSDALYDPSAAVTLRKQRQIIRTARVYRRIFRTTNLEYRYDVVSVVLSPGSRPKIALSKEFWTESKFRKRNWFAEAWHDHY